LQYKGIFINNQNLYIMTIRINSFQEWQDCQMGSWMLETAQNFNIITLDKKLWVLTLGKCAETVLHLMTDQRSIDSVKTMIAYGLGEAKQLKLICAKWRKNSLGSNS